MLSEQDITAIAEGVSAELEKKYGLEKETFQNMIRIVGVVQDIGDDNYNRGIETVRDMGRSYKHMRRISGYVANVLLYLGVAAMFGGILYVLRAGVQACLKSLK